MIRYLIRRLLWALVLFIAVTLVTYIIFFLVPANPARLAAGQSATPERIEEVEKFLGLDRPVYIQYLKFLDRLVTKLKALKIGDPLDDATDIGSIINERQFTKVCGYIEEGLRRPDARLLTGGLPPNEGPLTMGYFAIPTIFADASNDWRLAREEIFGYSSSAASSSLIEMRSVATLPGWIVVTFNPEPAVSSLKP